MVPNQMLNRTTPIDAMAVSEITVPLLEREKTDLDLSWTEPDRVKNQDDQGHGDDSTGSVPESDQLTRIKMLVTVIIPFAGVVAATVLFWQWGFMGWEYLAMMLMGWCITSLGITIGFHRLMTHRSFETYRWVRAAWMIIGTMSAEGSPLTWCAVHRRHHSHSDKEGDPHSPNLHGSGFWGMLKGLWHGQIGWLFTGYWSSPNLEKWIPDLLKDRLLVRLDQNYGWFVLLSLALPVGVGFLIDGWFGALLGFIWGGLVRLFLTHHVTWSINSVCHVFGSRDFRSSDHSTNNLICGILAWGEGWHNNHHAFPTSARHGLKWWQFDFSWIVIRTMKLMGLAWDIKVPSPQSLASRQIH
jgi:stearoyl-CoA desaturase (delta-9 desaturase)